MLSDCSLHDIFTVTFLICHLITWSKVIPSVGLALFPRFLETEFIYSILFETLVDDIKNWYYKVRQSLQNEIDNSYQKSSVTEVYYPHNTGRKLNVNKAFNLRPVSAGTKCARYCKVWQKFITKCVRYYKV